MIVEIIGPSGAGKSTLRRALDGSVLRLDGRRIVDLTRGEHFRNRERPAGDKCRGQGFHFLFANLLGFFLFRRVNLSDIPKALEWAATTLKVYGRAKMLDPNSEIGLLDEGILTRVQLSWGGGGWPRQIFEKYLSFFPRPTHILYVERPVEDLRNVWRARYRANPTMAYQEYFLEKESQAEETVVFANWFLSTYCDEAEFFEVSEIGHAESWDFDCHITLFPLRSNQ